MIYAIVILFGLAIPLFIECIILDNKVSKFEKEITALSMRIPNSETKPAYVSCEWNDSVKGYVIKGGDI